MAYRHSNPAPLLQVCSAWCIYTYLSACMFVQGYRYMHIQYATTVYNPDIVHIYATGNADLVRFVRDYARSSLSTQTAEDSEAEER